MPEPTSVAEPAEGALGNTTTGQPAAAGSSTGEPSAASDGNGGNEKLEKRLSDLQNQLSKMQSERDRLSGAVDLLSKQQTTTPQGPSEAELKAQRAALEAQIDEGLDGKTLLGLLDSYMVQAQEGAASLTKKEITELREALNGVTGRLGDYDPEWRKAEPIIEQLGLREKLGESTDRATLIRVANILSEAKGPDQPASAAIPGGTGGQAVTGPSDGMSDADVEQVCKASGLNYKLLTRANIDELKKKWSK